MRSILKPTTKMTTSCRGTSEKGFSLLELLVSMVIFMVVTGSIWGLLRVAQQSRSVVNQQVQLAKNVRIGLNLIGRDAYNAGYGYPLKNTVVLPDNKISILLGIPIDVNPDGDTAPPIIAGNNITLNTFNTVANIRTDQVTFLFKDPTFNLVGTAPNQVSEPLTISSATTPSSGNVQVESGSNASCRVNDLYILTGTTGSTLGLSTGLNGSNGIRFANSDIFGFNQTVSAFPGQLNGITAVRIYRVSMVTYFVTADGILTRREFGNILPAVVSVDEPLVYGVENFQIRYIMDDGSISDNPSAGADGVAGNADDVQANLAAVRQIRFTVSVRSIDLNSAGQPYRETMTTTYSTRNLGYDAN